MVDLKNALSSLDLASMSLDHIDGIDPQMARVLNSVEKWSTATVAHQNHSSHSDSRPEIASERDKEITLRRVAK